MVPWKLPANRIVAPNSPIPRANASAAAAPSAAAGERHRDAQHPSQRARAERAGDIEQRPVDALERGDRAAQIERAGDEQDRHHDRRLREREIDPEHAERVPEQPQTTERDQQPEPGDGRRHHQRQLDQRDHEAAAAKARRPMMYANGVPSAIISANAIALVFSETTIASVATGVPNPSIRSPIGW